MDTDCLSNMYFEKLNNKEVAELLHLFEKNPDTESDVFLDLKDCIWQEGICNHDFYIVTPQLIRIAANIDFSVSKDLWSYLGCWISTQEHDRNVVDGEILNAFDLALEYAEKECIKQIRMIEKMDDLDAQYLYASLFAFAKHRFGYMTLAAYKDDIIGTSCAKCPNGHMNDFSIYNSCIVPYEGEEKACDIANVTDVMEEYSKRKDNPWKAFADRFRKIIDLEEVDSQIKKHFELSYNIVCNGVTKDLNLKYAFSLYGCLLYCNGSLKESMRAFHAWDKVCCNECKEYFIFAEGWCEVEY